ncbi:Vms1/Ankzf1 family peptidyl-tRNA hydrolase [Streptomyces sp. TRM 70351]|uniref:baeRF2 domain-containing protein n=1 Tax=Streptomyces sp. TRM 70351 TaxID=3116552 RepID=UPI002E7C24CE|nr:Vms1/Ankzf1 family peptidyl-tRNA hydrolase [Streptomyces sp. TRM 70351]MEE1926937.1 Vms1/Ankzf1 family peptidyl-tRNA hydrolase [Streptomyces sp. TRM 70351]
MDLGFLTPLYERPGPWATVYVTAASATEDTAARQELLARDTGDRLAAQGADERTRQAVVDALRAGNGEQHAAGRAVFAAGGEVVLDRVLPAAPAGGMPDVTWAPLPHLVPLVDLAEAEPTCLLARVDRMGADFELRGPLGTEQVGGVNGDDWPLHRTADKDWSERKFQNAVENTWERNAATVAEELTACLQRTGAQLVVLAGEQRECVAVRDRLPEPVRHTAHLAEHGVRRPGNNAAAGEELLDRELAALRTGYVQRHAAEAMDRFRAGRGRGEDGHVDAAEGVPALVEAAQEHRIAQLLLRPDGPDLAREVWVGAEPGQIALRRTDAKALGTAEPVAARADDALLRVAAATGADVLSVRPLTDPEGTGDNVPDEPSGGLGAVLRWPYQGEEAVAS